MMNKWFVGLLVATAGCMLSGCGDEPEKIMVKGIVFCDNKPISGANVAFVGNEGGAFAMGITDSKGEFVLRAVPGKNKVSVGKPNTTKVKPVDPNADQSMPTEGEVAAMVKAAPKPDIAAKFADAEKSGIVIDVVSGMSTVDIMVTSK